MHPLQRAWVATSTSGQEQWDSVIGSKQWKRRAGSGGYEYYYSVTSGTMDVDNEMEWHGAEWYSERGVAVPPELLGTPSATAEPVVEDDDSDDEEEEEWDVNALFDAVRREGLQGICNAMTAAYLLDFLDPSIDKVGMTELAFQKTALLKDLLDRVVTFYTDYDASDVTFAFVSWGQQKGLDSDWLAGLKDSNVTARFQEFRTYFHTARSALPARGGVTIAGKYADMNLEDVATKIDDMLEPWFSMSTNFQGVLVIKAQVEGASGMTGTREVVKNAKPDGYTLLSFADSTWYPIYCGMTDYKMGEFELVANLFKQPLVAIVRSDAPWNSMKDLVKHAKDKPNTVRWAMSVGNQSHFIPLNIEKQTGAKFKFVAVPGGDVQRQTALLAGNKIGRAHV